MHRRPTQPLSAALVALGLAPRRWRARGRGRLTRRKRGPRPRGLIDNFSLANALRAGVAAGGGPELLVHLAAIAREAGVAGFDQMIRVLAPETPEVAPEWLTGARRIRPPLLPRRHAPRRPHRYGQPEREPAVGASCAGRARTARLRQGQGVGRRSRLPRPPGRDRAGGRVPRLRLRGRGRLERAAWAR